MGKLNPPYINAVFCDDVRREEGGKVSLMGIYQSTLTVTGTILPIVLPKICILVEARSPSDQRPKKLVVRVMLDEDELARGDFTEEQLQADPPHGPHAYTTHGLVFQLQPFAIAKNGILRVRADVDDEEILVGGINIIATTTNQTSSIP